MKLSEIPLCVECGKPPIGPGKGPFYVLRTSLAMVDPRAASGLLGTVQIMSGGRPPTGRSLLVAEALAPGSDDFVMILADKDPKLGTEIVVCQDCFMASEDLPRWLEKSNEKSGG